MVEKAGGRMTVPQIFVNDSWIGDCDGIYALDRAGRLDDLLNPV
jgi:glutaredoxin 3